MRSEIWRLSTYAKASVDTAEVAELVDLPAGRQARTECDNEKFEKEVMVVYAIRSRERNYIYVGMTSDLNGRLERHNKGYERTTRPYRPFSLIYTEEFPDRISARKKEKYLKSGVGKEFLKSL